MLQERRGPRSSLFGVENLSFFPIFCLVPVPGCLMVKLANFLQIDCRLGQVEFHIFHRTRNDLGDRKIPEPLVVRGDDEPGRLFGRTLRKGGLERINVLIPKFALGIITVADFPLPPRIVGRSLKRASCSYLDMYKKNLRMVVFFSSTSSLSQSLMNSKRRFHTSLGTSLWTLATKTSS